MKIPEFTTTPPQDILAEQTLLGCLLTSEEDHEVYEAVMNTVQEKDFYREAHQRIFRVMTSLLERGETVNIVTVMSELQRLGVFDQTGGGAYLFTPLDSSLYVSQAKESAKLVKRCSLRRDVQTEALRLFDAAQKDGDFDEASRRIQEVALALPGVHQAVNADSERDIALEFLSDALGRTERVGARGLSTGIPALDRKTDGLLPGLMWVVAARPSIGKTSFALSVIQHVAQSQPVYFFSLEQTKKQIVARLLSMLSGLSQNVWGHEVLTDWQRDAISDGVSRFDRLKLTIDETPGLTVGELRRRVRLANSRDPLGLIVVDHAGEVQVPGEYGYNAMSQIAPGIKAIGKEFHVPVLLLCQLSRASEKREDKRPMMGDGRDSGRIEEVADIWAGLYRDAYYNRASVDAEEEQEAELNILKNREGATGLVKLNFHPATTFFSESFEEEEGYV